ncbi:hypothetical protein GOP47_0031130, partial [Adiantum capillus-veneris]
NGGKDQKGEVDDDKSLPKKKDGDKDPIIEVDDNGVSKELLKECLPLDDAVNKARFLEDKDPPIGVDVNEHTI